MSRGAQGGPAPGSRLRVQPSHQYYKQHFTSEIRGSYFFFLEGITDLGFWVQASRYIPELQLSKT